MYCIKCGVNLCDTEEKCPLCGTVVYHGGIEREKAEPFYPEDKRPKAKNGRVALGGIILILFFIPTLLTFLSDLLGNGKLEWFGLALGGIALFYIIFALPLWFKKPNPVIFVPAGFVAGIIYLLYICLFVRGNWFLSFAFPASGALLLIVSAAVTLFHYIKKGRLYILGGFFILLGGFTLLLEFLLYKAFSVGFVGWSVYPLASLVLLGGLLIYLGINKSAREILKRKLFF